MQLSEGVEWGIHSALLLASCQGAETIPGKALAAAYGLSESYLVKHLKVMVTAGILQSVPGPYGGYKLAKPLDQITLLRIYEAFEGNGTIFRCQEIRRCGELAMKNKQHYKHDCQIKTAMHRAEQAYRNELANTKLSDIAAEFLQSADKKLLHHIQSWTQQNHRSPVNK